MFKKNKVWSTIIIILTIIINLGCLQTQIRSKKIVSSGELYIAREEYNYTPQFFSIDDSISQYFVPQKKFLDSVMIRLASVDEGINSDEWVMQVGLYDEEDNYICSADISSDDYNSWNAYTFKIEQNVVVGNTYKLMFRQIIGPEKEWPTSMKCFLAIEDAKESTGYFYNDEYQQGNLEICYRYSYSDLSPLWIIGVLDIIIAIVLVLIWRLNCNCQMLLFKKLGVSLWIVTPLVIFYLVQKIVGGSFDVLPKYIVSNLIIYYLIFIALTLLFKKVILSTIIYSVLMLLSALIQYFVMLFRGSPFMLCDLFAVTTAMAVWESYSFDISVDLGVYLQIFIIFITLQIFFQNICLPDKKRDKIIRGMGFCVVVSLITIMYSMAIKNVKSSENDLWDVETVYREQGYIYSLILQGQFWQVDEPENYSVVYAQEIVDNNFVQEQNVTPDNLIIIMNESLADLSIISEINVTDGKILPYIQSMQKNTKKGYLYVPIFGGGTSDSEYEVLTGNTKYFLPIGSNAYQLYCQQPVYSMVSSVEAQGYNTVAIHPNYAVNWKREEVYEAMGFDEFISLDNWGYDFTNLRWCMSDQATYEKLVKLYERKDVGKKWFSFCVTMQNHGGYTEDTAYGYLPTVSLAYNMEYPQAEMYLSLINESDVAFQDLINYFENVEEKTMIVMFGDHLPAVEEEFYEMLYKKKLEDLSIEEMQLRYKVPYVIWTNYYQETSEQDMSSNYFGSYIMQQAGLELTPYNEFLLNLKQEIPIIGIGAICDAKGEWYTLDNLPQRYENLLNNYEILQYNNIFDKGNIIKDIFTIGEEG